MIGTLVPAHCLNDGLLPSHPMDRFLWDGLSGAWFITVQAAFTAVLDMLRVELEKAIHLFRSFSCFLSGLYHLPFI